MEFIWSIIFIFSIIFICAGIGESKKSSNQMDNPENKNCINKESPQTIESIPKKQQNDDVIVPSYISDPVLNKSENKRDINKESPQTNESIPKKQQNDDVIVPSYISDPVLIKAVHFYKEGFELYRERDFDAAINILTESLTLNPNFPEAYCLRGDCFAKKSYQDKERRDKAIEDYSQAIALNDQYVSAYISIGKIYLMGTEFDLDNAIKNFSQAILINPHEDIAYCYRAEAYVKKGLFENAAQDKKKELDLFLIYGSLRNRIINNAIRH